MADGMPKVQHPAQACFQWILLHHASFDPQGAFNDGIQILIQAFAPFDAFKKRRIAGGRHFDDLGQPG